MANVNDVLIGDQMPDTTSATPLDGVHDTTPLDEPVKQDAPKTEPDFPVEGNGTGLTVGDTVVENGTELETPDGVLTFKDGALYDKNGNLFKNKDEVQGYVNQFSQPDYSADNLSIETVKNLFNIDFEDDNGKTVDFSDDAKGKEAYINSVLQSEREIGAHEALTNFFNENPVIRDFADFIAAGGNPNNFGEIPDRSRIAFDENNEAQHEAIIRTAWAENNTRGDVNKYIAYLKSTGSLKDTAREELANIQARDIEYRQALQQQAAAARENEIAELQQYWSAIKGTIDSGRIGGYAIPTNIVRNLNGTRVAATRNDFFNYVSRIADTKSGMTQYQIDLDNLSDEDAMNRELLDAYLRFSGGSYQDLINMAVKEAEVTRLKLVAKQSKNQGAIKMNKAKSNKVDIKDIIL